MYNYETKNPFIHGGGIAMNTFYEARPGCLFVGSMTQFPFPLHVHEVAEISYLFTGSCVMQIDGSSYELRAGDAAICFPLVPHSYDWLSDDISGFSAFLPSDAIAEFASTFHTLLPDVPVLRAEKVSADMRMSIDRLMSTSDQKVYPPRLAFVHLLLANLLPQLRFHATGTYNELGLANRVVRYVFDHACEDITLRSAAHGLGISESHLSHLFAQQFRINFRRFINAIRIDKAKMLMRDPNLTLTQIAFTCGYENMRTFRRAFTRETGELPAAYVRALRGSAALIAPEEDDAEE